MLAEERYDDFIAMYGSSRISKDGLILALRYLDSCRPVLKIDNPLEIKCDSRRIYIAEYQDGSGCHIDYDLTTDGQPNDLTVQVELLNQGEGYRAVLEDLHAL